MTHVMQMLLDAGLNAWGAELLAESLLKHPKPEDLQFFLPITRRDCQPWIGVQFCLRPIKQEKEIKLILKKVEGFEKLKELLEAEELNYEEIMRVVHEHSKELPSSDECEESP